MTMSEWLAIGIALPVGLWALVVGQRVWGALLTLGLLLAAWGLTLAPWVWAVLAGVTLLLLAVEKLPNLSVRFPVLARLMPPDHKQRHWNRWRTATQWLLVAAMAIAAIQYALYMWQLGDAAPSIARPNIVDAFLPVAAAIQLKALFSYGLWDSAHPAGLMLLLVALLLSVVVKRGFCGWACPIGWLGEQLYQLRRRVLPVNAIERLQLSDRRWSKAVLWLTTAVDWLLRAVKYALLAAMINLVFLGMPGMMVMRYLNGAYHQAADMKMWVMFSSPSALTLVGIVSIVALAAVRRNGFCRYLCPYGALMAIVGAFSPLKIRRDTDRCLRNTKGMDCDKCQQACPSRINVHLVNTVHSDECNSCQRCVSACPSRGALASALPMNRIKLTPLAMVVIIVVTLFVIPLMGAGLGLWNSDVTDQVRMMLWQNIDKLPMF